MAPSGKLPVTFPRAVGQIPIYYGFKNTGRPPSTAFRGIPTGTPLDPVGFESSYLDVEVSPLYPFGFGDMKATIEPGKFAAFVGGDSRASLTATFELERVSG